MTDRAQSALKATGMDETPLASLEKDDALFALTAQTLLFQDGGGTRRVTLRDLTRIHSDQEGMLRVETPAGTALTASLLGFDAARVQAFFAHVRDTTARAKQQAAAPLPTSSLPSGGEKTFVNAPATPAIAVAPPPVAPEFPKPTRSKPEPRTAPPTIVIGDSEAGDEEAGADAPAASPVTRTVVSPAPSTPAPNLTKPTAASAAAPVPPTHTTPPPTTPAPTSQPVVISSSGFSPSSTRPTVPYGSGTASPAAAAATPAPKAAAPKVAAPTVAAPTPPVAAAPTPTAPALQPTAIKTLPTRSASVSGLYAQADAVEALVSRLRILGVVLGVSAIALAFFLFTAGQGLSGIWTLIAGGVGGIALLTLAELARLLVGIARATGNGGGSDNG